MATKREYLKQQGITVGVRGRFSGAAKVALAEATAKGITFTAETPAKKAKQQTGTEVGASLVLDLLSYFWYNRQLGERRI